MSGRNARIALLLFFGFFLVILPILFLTGLDTGLDRRSAGGRTAVLRWMRSGLISWARAAIFPTSSLAAFMPLIRKTSSHSCPLNSDRKALCPARSCSNERPGSGRLTQL